MNFDEESHLVNAKHDITSYENCDYLREIYDCNLLYESYLKARKGSQWKPQVQKFGLYYLLNIVKISNELRDYKYELKPTSNFVLNERGKTRNITGEQIEDRIVNHSACDEQVNPKIAKYLIYDNGASVEGKGISFTRNRVKVHLQKFYKEYGNNGYVLLIDFSKYYDNIQHDKLMNIFRKYISDEHTLWVLQKSINRARIDVSYMNDEEYSNCLNSVFNSLEYANIDKSLLTGDKFMAKHMEIGNQISQSGGIAYRIALDNFAKIVKGIKYYDAYMDDTLIIHQSKEFLQQFLNEFIVISNYYGIAVNLKKTRICKLSEYWRFLQFQYCLTDTGRIIIKINPKRLVGMKRKMRKLANVLSLKEFDNFYKAWFKNHYKYMSKNQRKNIDELYYTLRRKIKCRTQLH